MRQWTFGFRKMRGICWLAENRLASQEGLCSMELAGRSEQIPLRFAHGTVLFGINCLCCFTYRAVTHGYTLSLQIASNEWYQATHITKKLVSRNWFNSAWNYICKKLSLFSPTYTRENPYTGFQATVVSYLKYRSKQFAVFIRGIRAVVAWNCSLWFMQLPLGFRVWKSKLRAPIFQVRNCSCLKPGVRIWRFFMPIFTGILPVALTCGLPDRSLSLFINARHKAATPSQRTRPWTTPPP
jgi:hypothetical protein